MLCGTVAGVFRERLVAVVNDFARLWIGHHLFIFALVTVDHALLSHPLTRLLVELVATELLKGRLAGYRILKPHLDSILSDHPKPANSYHLKTGQRE